MKLRICHSFHHGELYVSASPPAPGRFTDFKHSVKTVDSLCLQQTSFLKVFLKFI